MIIEFRPGLLSEILPIYFKLFLRIINFQGQLSNRKKSVLFVFSNCSPDQ